MNNKKLTTCKACGAQIAKSAKTCPQCGAKNKKKHVFLGIVLCFFGIMLIAAGMGGGSESSSNQGADDQAAEPITYTAYNVADMVKDLETNALKAEEKYNDQYVEVTGRLALIDSDGRYISLFDENNPFAIVGVQCFIQNDEQKAQVMDLAIDDIVTVQGKITEVGEIMSFMLDIDTIL